VFAVVRFASASSIFSQQLSSSCVVVVVVVAGVAVRNAREEIEQKHEN